MRHFVLDSPVYLASDKCKMHNNLHLSVPAVVSECHLKSIELTGEEGKGIHYKTLS